MATYTADAAQNNFVREAAVGETVVVARYIAGGVTISSGDVYQMVRVPNGATITGIQYYGRSSGTGGIVFDVGISTAAATTASVFGKATVSATDQFVSSTLNLPYTVSISDDAAVQHAVVSLTQSGGTATATGTFGLVVRFCRAGSGRPT